METRILGKTGLKVGRLGLGLGEIAGFALDDEDQARALINTALDRGMNFLETAAVYGHSEELIGRTLGSRRGECYIATKCGSWHPAHEWSAQEVTENIDRSLVRLKTDYLDLVQLHSCGVPVLERGDVIQALLDARDAGKTRFVGYSGDNEAAEWAVESGIFDTLLTTFNLVDQRARTRLFPSAREKNMGIIVKRPLANATWGGSKDRTHTTVQYRNMYDRVQQMQSLGPIQGVPGDRILLALGFAMAHPAR